MAFDPSRPATGEAATSQLLRDQFTGLKALIDAIPAGPPGPPGPDGATGSPGSTFGNVTVDTVTTLSPGTPAAASATFDGVTVHFTFDIPAGQDGLTGPPGDVSLAQLSDAVNLTSANSNGVQQLLPITPDPTLLEVAQKLDELIQALRR